MMIGLKICCEVLKDSGILHVPNLNKSFNKKGEEINESR